MTVFTEGKHTAEHIIEEIGVSFSREEITVVSGAGVILPGTVLGKITASGKYKPATATGSDGAQIASVVSIYGCDATSADAKVVVSARGTVVNSKLVTYGSTIDDAAKKAAANVQLAASGIIVR
jgi:hypothetical protein